MHGNRHFWREFRALHDGSSRQVFVLPARAADVRIKTEINGDIVPGCLLDRTETCLGKIAQRNAGLWTNRQKAFVIECGKIKAESVEIIREKHGTADFRI